MHSLKQKPVAVAIAAIGANAISTELQSKYLQQISTSIPLMVAHFNELPDCAHVRQPTVLALFACSPASLWRWVKSGRLPAPKKLGLRVSAWNVGELRACLNSLQTSDQGSVKVRGE